MSIIYKGNNVRNIGSNGNVRNIINNAIAPIIKIVLLFFAIVYSITFKYKPRFLAIRRGQIF